MSAEQKARVKVDALERAAAEFRRTGGVIERKEVVRSVSPELLRRVELLETQNLQMMQGFQAILQRLEDERAMREGMETELSRWAESHLQKRAG